MTDFEVQTQCPAIGCDLEVTDMAEALGWTKVGDLVWCPAHYPERRLALRRQAEEIRHYENYAARRRANLDQMPDAELHVIASAKARGLDRRDPQVKKELARLKRQAEQWQQEIARAEHARMLAERLHERKNAQIDPSGTGAMTDAEASGIQNLIEAADDHSESWPAVEPWELPDGG
jgi:hypothetical protein